MRKTSEELQQLLKEKGFDRLWSWSKWNSFCTSPYEYYLKYIHKPRVEEDRTDCIYTTTGSIAHEIMEKYYTGEIQYKDMINLFEDGWIMATDILNLKFDRNSEEKNENIKNKYYLDLKHFFETHTNLDETFKKDSICIEDFITAEIKGNLFQGYIDAYATDKEGNIHILDFKTSTIYKGEKAEENCGQLVVYAIGMSQKGIPIDKIRIGWDFLKYATIECKQLPLHKITFQNAKGEVKIKEIEKDKIFSTLKATIKGLCKKLNFNETKAEKELKKLEESQSINQLDSELKQYISEEILEVESKFRDIERSKIGESLQAAVKKLLKKFEYSLEDIERYSAELLSSNDINCLPDKIRDLFVIRDCIVYVPLTEKLIEKWINNIDITIQDILLREKDYEETKSNKSFWDSDESVKKQSYYFATLCGYSPNLHLPYKEYLEKLESSKNGSDMFSSVGNVTKENNTLQVFNNNKTNDTVDLSWLNGI